MATTPRREPHPDMAPLIEARKIAARGATLAEQRAAWAAYAKRFSPPRPAGMVVRDAAVPTPHREAPVRIYRPAAASGALPGILFMHGDGFAKGDLDSSDALAWGLTQETGAVTISVDYRLAPEHPYPAAFDDCREVLVWISRNARAFEINPARIAVAGEGAGGHLAASLCLAARDRGGPRLVAQALVCAATGSDMTAPSFAEHVDAEGPIMADYRAFVRALSADGAHADDPYARPAMAEDFRGLPPTYVVSAELDPMRDDGRNYAAKLAAAGVDTVYREARGMIHGFMRARFAGAAVRAEYERLCAFLRSHLHPGGERPIS